MDKDSTGYDDLYLDIIQRTYSTYQSWSKWVESPLDWSLKGIILDE